MGIRLDTLRDKWRLRDHQYATGRTVLTHHNIAAVRSARREEALRLEAHESAVAVGEALTWQPPNLVKATGGAGRW